MSKATEIVTSLANDLRESITAIEARPATTRGHYGTYLGLFSRFCDDAGQARMLALALVEAGANKRGVYDAMHICYP